MNFTNYTIIMIEIMISIAFLTLFERTMIGSMNFRMGPNIFIMLGISQPINDLIKLFMKNSMIYYFTESMNFFMFPIWSLMIMMMYWMIFPFNNMNFFFFFSVILFIIFYSLMTYKFIFMGWSSMNTYGMISSYRTMVQTLSYEVGLFFLILIVFSMSNSTDMFTFVSWKMNLLMFFSPIFFLMTSLIFIVELSRSPFDFMESESELVSGFNIEYSGFPFSMIFLIEYSMLILTSMMISMMFLNMMIYPMMLMTLITVRALLIRYRYDTMIKMFWKDILFTIFSWMTFILIYL